MGVKLSVIVAVYNVEPYIRQCLDSLVSQTFRDIEIILVDDGSPDNCGAICDEYAAKDPRIKVIHKENGGVATARNAGLAAVTGEWLTFVDPDDWCDEDYFAKALQELEKTDVDIVCRGGYIREDKYGSKPRQVILKPFYFTSVEDTYKLMLRCFSYYPLDCIAAHEGIMVVWGKYYRVSFLRANDLRFAPGLNGPEDNFFNACAFSCAPRVRGTRDGTGYHYRIKDVSLTYGYHPHEKMDRKLLYLERLEGFRLDRFEQDKEVLAAVNAAANAVLFNMLKVCYANPSNPDSYRVRAAQFREMKRYPLIRRGLYASCGRRLAPTLRVFKGLAMLPWFWPLLLFVGSYRWAKDRENKVRSKGK